MPNDVADEVELEHSSADLITAASISYRQLDYWTRKKYLRTRTNRRGSGHPRDYSDAELAIAVRMARLIAVGFTPKRAAAIARHVATHRPGDSGAGWVCVIGQGFLLTASEDHL